MDRRSFLVAGVAAGAGAVLHAQTTESKETAVAPPAAGQSRSGFKLNYAPCFGMFQESAGKDPIDQIKFAADQGFHAFFDNGLATKPTDLQEKIASELKRLGMTLGAFTTGDKLGDKTYVVKDPEMRKTLVEKMKVAVDVAKRTNAKWCLAVPNAYEPSVDWDYQTAIVIDNLKACAEVCEPSGLVIVIEPLNKRNHPGMFLTSISQAYAICRAVNSPSCKIIDDLYHQQITEGDLIPNIDEAWSEIAHFHLGDNPGRKEPTTGEINYRNIFKHLYEKKFTGVLGMEHGKSKPGKEGEQALLAAYRKCDDFLNDA